MRVNSVIVFLCVMFLCSSIDEVKSARILAVFPIASISHQVVFRKYVQALSKAGHELVVVTTDPFPPSKNMTIIDISIGYKILNQLFEHGRTFMKLPKGVIMDVNFINADNYIGLLHMFTEEFKTPDVEKLLNDKSQKFDLLIIEALLEYPLYWTKIFNAPTIQISSYYGRSDDFGFMGAVSRHPIYYPNHSRNTFKYLSIWDKIVEVYQECRIYFEFGIKLPAIQNAFLKAALGKNAPTVEELRNNVDLLFINADPIFDNNRPVAPNIVYLGGLHLEPPKDLPKDLKAYLDKSERGVIYVSLGTNVKTDFMDKEYLEVFLNAFKALPYDILWKLDSGELEGKPDNIKIQKWFPQRDLLMHKNIKLFITQGGLQSTDEAVDAKVPMVAVPALGDQWYNGHKYEELGIGVILDPITLTSDVLAAAAMRVIENDSYRRNLARVKELVNDHPQTSLERALWWTEHVLRQEGGKHLRPSSFNIEWSEFLMLDVVLAIGATLFGISVVSISIIGCFLIVWLRKKNVTKIVKDKKNK